MADLNEPQKETVRINPTSSAPVRPAPPIAPKPLPPGGGSAAGKRPPAPPMARPPAPVRPPGHSPTNPPPPPPGSKSAPPPQAAVTLPTTPPLATPGLSPPPSAVPLKPTAPSSDPAGSNRGRQIDPRKEPSRLGAMLYPPIKATVRLTPIQPPSAPPPPAVANQPAPGLLESVPMPFCWALLGISAVTLLTQLWTYFS